MLLARLCKILGILIVIITAIGCMAYGAANMPKDPLKKAELKNQVRTVGSVPLLAGVGLIVYGHHKQKKLKAAGQGR